MRGSNHGGRGLFFRGKADAYLEWGRKTKFMFVGKHWPPRAVAPKKNRVGLVVKCEKEFPRDEFADFNLYMPGWYNHCQIVAISIEDDPRAWKKLRELDKILRVELAAPITVEDSVELRPSPELGPKKPTLLAVIDDGCPFGSSRFLDPQGKRRLQYYWDQNKPLLNDLTPPANPPPVAMQTRATHGAAVMDIMAGPIPAANRLSPSRFTASRFGNAVRAPTWEKAPDTAQSRIADIAFVQFPKSCVDDPSGRWLGRNALDALHLVNWIAREKQRYDRVIANMSWGPQTGPHDGSGLLEQAMSDLVRRYSLHGGEFLITLPVGNSYSSRNHAELNFGPSSGSGANRAQCSSAPLTWCVPPGSESPAFLEIWWPTGTEPEDVTVRAVGPDRVGSLVLDGREGFSSAYGDTCWMINVQSKETGTFMTLVALAPTTSFDGEVAPAGRWVIESRLHSKPSGPAQVYVARADHNMGAAPRGVPSHLYDARYEAARKMPEFNDRPDDPSYVVRRCGTANGIATGADVHVAAGYVAATEKPTDYSSAGPTRPGGAFVPDYAYPADESPALQGLVVGGMRSGGVVRIVGTSTASPQYARELADTLITVPPPHTGPLPPDPPVDQYLVEVRIGDGLER